MLAVQTCRLGIVSGLLIALPAQAALPVFYGPTSASYSNLYVPGRRAINNSGVAIATVVSTTTGQYNGVSWQPTPSAALTPYRSLINNGTDYVELTAINDSGVIVGTSAVPTAIGSASRAVRYASGSQTPVQLIATNSSEYVYSRAVDVNASGAVVGTYNDNTSSTQQYGIKPQRWLAGATTPHPLPLGIPSYGAGNVTTVQVNELTDTNISIGSFTRYAPDGSSLGTRAVRWSAAGTSSELGAPSIRADGYTETATTGVNNSGVAVGSAVIYSGYSTTAVRAVRWNTGGIAPTLLNTVGNVDINGVSLNLANDINDAGTTVGFGVRFLADGSSYYAIPIRWAAGGTTGVELGSLGVPTNPTFGSNIPGAIASVVNSIGTAAGSAEKIVAGVSTGQHAVIWTANSTSPIDLATRITQPANGSFVPTAVTALTDTGFVLGNGIFTATVGGTTQERLYSMLIPEAGTYGRGDANFDTVINFDDLLLLAQHYGEANASQNIHVGDFDLNGSVNFDDLLALAQHYQSAASIDTSSLGSTFSADWALARSIVPEPASGLVVGSALACTRRRRNAVA